MTTLLIPILAITFAAFCVWLTVRIVNRRERWAKWAAIVIAVLLSYPGAYIALLERKVYWPIGVDAVTQQNLYEAAPHYRLQGQMVETLFAPAHWIDRRVRNDFWITIENSSGRKWRNPS